MSKLTIKQRKLNNVLIAGGAMASVSLVFAILPAIGAAVVRKALKAYLNSSVCICNHKLDEKDVLNYRYLKEQKLLAHELKVMRLWLGGPWNFPPPRSSMYKTAKSNKIVPLEEAQMQKEEAEQQTAEPGPDAPKPEEATTTQSAEQADATGKKLRKITVTTGYDKDFNEQTKDVMAKDPPYPLTAAERKEQGDSARYVEKNQFGWIILNILMTTVLIFIIFWTISGSILNEQMELCAGPKCKPTKKDSKGVCVDKRAVITKYSLIIAAITSGTFFLFSVMRYFPVGSSKQKTSSIWIAVMSSLMVVLVGVVGSITTSIFTQNMMDDTFDTVICDEDPDGTKKFDCGCPGKTSLTRDEMF